MVSRSRRNTTPYIAVFENDEAVRKTLAEIIEDEGFRPVEGKSVSELFTRKGLATRNRIRSPLLHALLADVGFREEIPELSFINRLLEQGTLRGETSIIFTSTNAAHLEKIKTYRPEREGIFSLVKPFDLNNLLHLLTDATRSTLTRRERNMFILPSLQRQLSVEQGQQTKERL